MSSSAVTPAAFIDRDGVINEDHGYVSCWDDFSFLGDAIVGLRQLQSLGFALVVVTNQSGIGRGYYDEGAFQRLTDSMTKYLAAQGVTLLTVKYCPHHPEATVAPYRKTCSCRKPAPGLLLRAADTHGLALARSIMVGDKPSDIEAGKRAGVVRCYHVTQGEAASDSTRVGSLLDVARHETRILSPK